MNPSHDSLARPLVKAKAVEMAFNGKHVLRGIDLEVFSGEVVTLIGPNGSGKTTLLRILLNLQIPTGGKVYKRLGLRIGYVPQNVSLDPNLPITVQKYLTLFGPHSGELELVAEELDMNGILHLPLQSLSGGELQRVMIAQALIGDPQLLVLDEPVQGVDMINQAALYALIRSVSRARNCAVLMVSHDLHLVMAGTDRVLCLNQHICCSGTPHAVSRDPAFVELFGPDIANQIALYIHQHDHHHTLSGAVELCEGHPHDA
jgi:zinc transport system ATP-binding protein